MLGELHDAARQGWLLALVVVWAVLLFGGLAAGHLSGANSGSIMQWTRLGSSLALVVAAWSWFVFTRTGPAGGYSLLIALGMTLGFVGDVLLGHVLPLAEPLLYGIAAFGLGHVCYITAILRFGNARGLDAAGPRWGAEAVWLLIGLVAWYFVVYRGGTPTMLHWAALPYALLLASTVGFATGLALQAPQFVPLVVGGALFLTSDLLLAANTFNNLTFANISDVIWVTYAPAQALIVYSIGAALGLKQG